MLAFRTIGGAEFRYALDFTDHDFANISFFATNRRDIPFHLSVRFKTSRAVVNARNDGVWGKEAPHEVALQTAGDEVCIRFCGEGVSVLLNGSELFVLNDGFPTLEDIAAVNFNGGLVRESITVAGEANRVRQGEGELSMDGFLEVAGWAVDPALPRQHIRLWIDGLGESLSLVPVERPDIVAQFRQTDMTDISVGLTAHLPGRIWESPEGPRDHLVLRMTSNGIPCGEPLVISRVEIAMQIDRHVPGFDLGERGFELLLAIEHVRFAHLWEMLDTATRSRLMEAADLYGLRDYMIPARDPAANTDLPAAPVSDAGINPQVFLLTRIRTDFAHAVRRDDTRSLIEILDATLKHHPLPPAACQQLFVSVTEAFCNRSCFEDLFEYTLARKCNLHAPNGNRWHDSAILPFLLMNRQMADLRRVLWQLVEEGEGWVVTPALAWTIRTILYSGERYRNEADSENCIYAFISFIDRRSAVYWERSCCAALIETSALLALSTEDLPEGLARDIIRFALRNFGLSNRFWQRLEALSIDQGAELPVELTVARNLFGDIRDRAHGKPVDIGRALAFFKHWRNPETDRFRRELLGASGADAAEPRNESVLERLCGDGEDPGETLLRGFAQPGAPMTSPDPRTRHVLHETIRARHDKLPKAPFYHLQFEIARCAIDALDRIAADPSLSETRGRALLRPILDRLPGIASKRSQFLGLGLGIRLIHALAQLQREDLAYYFLAQVNILRANMPGPEQSEMSSSAAVRMALDALARSGLAHDALVQATLRISSDITPVDMSRHMIREPDVGVSPLRYVFDTVVAVFSCRAFLDSRIEEMRKGWLSQLEALGIPYLVFVGEGDGTRVGDVVYLDAPDDYEGLPQKTLATIRWITEHTDFSHMLKIDDDCFLDVREFFTSLSYLKHDFYGRVIPRQPGDMDRTWHCGKSSSDRGRKELDKSPEPSVYCDGGSGYTLSRRAMHAVNMAAASTDGRRLIAASFMEDKMVGDLLKLQDIMPCDEDYYVAVRRRCHGDGAPVSLWENSFMPGPLSPVKLVHLDSHIPQAATLKGLETPRLTPHKIWPTYGPAALGYNTNLLELVSDADTLARVNRAPVAVVACMRNERFMLPHFLEHYRKLGVGAFLVADNVSTDGTLEYLLEQPDVAVFSADSDYAVSQYGVAWQMTMIANLRVGRWSLIADADEFLVYPGSERVGLPDLLVGEAWANTDAVRIYMLDMYPKGPLAEARFDKAGPFEETGYVDCEPFLRNITGTGPFSDSPTVTSALRHRLIAQSRPEIFVAQKYALLRYMPWMRPSAGFHYVADLRVAKQEMIFAHFKYNAQFRQKALDETRRGQHFNNAEEYRKYLALMAEGRDRIYDPDISVPWQSCPEVRRILAQ